MRGPGKPLTIVPCSRDDHLLEKDSRSSDNNCRRTMSLRRDATGSFIPRVSVTCKIKLTLTECGFSIKIISINQPKICLI